MTTHETAHEKNSFKEVYKTIIESLKGAQRDYTKGSISKAVFLLAIPMILELSLESVFAVVDMFFVGKLGENAIASVGLTESMISLVYSLAVGLSTAAAAVIARRIGEKDPEGAAHAGAQSLLVALVVTAFLSVMGVIFAGDILAFMGASKEVVAEGTIFTRIMFGGSIVIILLFLINGIFRGAGNAAMAMKSLWIASGVNIILCPILIHFFGLQGAAMATVMGRSSGVLYQVYHLLKGKGVLKFKKKDFKFDPKIIATITKIAWPATIQFMVASGSWIILTRLVAETGGTAASAGYQIAFRNFLFFILPAWGLSNAAATLVGQNLGAQQPERAEKSVLLTAKYSAIFMGFVTLVFIFCSQAIVGVFTQDPEVLRFGTLALQIIGSGFVFYGVSMVMTQSLNGAGDTRTPTLINFICFWIFQIPFAYALALGLGFGATGAVWAIPAAQLFVAILSWYYFKRGKWKQIKV